MRREQGAEGRRRAVGGPVVAPLRARCETAVVVAEGAEEHHLNEDLRELSVAVELQVVGSCASVQDGPGTRGELAEEGG